MQEIGHYQFDVSVDPLIMELQQTRRTKSTLNCIANEQVLTFPLIGNRAA